MIKKTWLLYITVAVISFTTIHFFFGASFLNKNNQQALDSIGINKNAIKQIYPDNSSESPVLDQEAYSKIENEINQSSLSIEKIEGINENVFVFTSPKIKLTVLLNKSLCHDLNGKESDCLIIKTNNQQFVMETYFFNSHPIATPFCSVAFNNSLYAGVHNSNKRFRANLEKTASKNYFDCVSKSNDYNTQLSDKIKDRITKYDEEKNLKSMNELKKSI